MLIFGSFTEQEVYNDLDLAIYCDENHPRVSNLFYDVSLSREIEKAVQIPVDIIVLNHAPDRLVYRASRFSSQRQKRSTSVGFSSPSVEKCLDFQEVLKKYRQELKNANR